MPERMKKELEKYFDRLWPICRSITGNGLRRSLDILQEIIPLKIHEVPSGTRVFDWTVPDEWNIKDAFIITPEGKKIASFAENNLHVVNYSEPVKGEFTYEQLLPHLHTLPDQPDAIPYITSYYKPSWGFCLTHKQFKSLPKKGRYKVLIDATLKSGNLTMADLVLAGETDREILFSTYVCHPSMANNELSGPLVTAFLYRLIASLPHRKFTYRFVFAPETIGVITYLSRHGFNMRDKTDAGFVVTCVGDKGPFTYKRSRRTGTLTDRAAEHYLSHSKQKHRIVPFDVGGSDERQYCSPGFNMPVGSLMRTMYKEFPQYHTSLDNKKFISFDAMEATIRAYFEIVQLLELNDTYTSAVPFGEAFLGKRGLYEVNRKDQASSKRILDTLYVLAYTDGAHDLLSIASQRNLSVDELKIIVTELLEQNLLIKTSKANEKN